MKRIPLRSYVPASVLLAGLAACSSSDLGRSAVHEDVASQTSAFTALGFTVTLPTGNTVESVAVSANGSLRIDDRAVVESVSGTPAAVANAGRTGTAVGTDASMGTITSESSVTVAQRSTIMGNVVATGAITLAQGATVVGTQTPNATLPTTTVTWTAPTPGTSLGNVTVSPNGAQTLQAGTYGNLVAYAGATVTLTPGVYLFSSVDIEPGATLAISGSTIVYVASNLIYHGAIQDTGASASLLLAYAGTNAVTVESSFTGTLVAPNASLAIASVRHVGAFFGKDVEVRAGATIVHQPLALPPSPCVGVADGTSCTTAGAGSSVCSQGSCVNVACNSGAQPFSVSADFGGGPVVFTQTSQTPASGPTSTTATITRSGALVETRTVVGPDASGIETLQIVFGASIHGIHEIDATTDGHTVSEVVDGRALEPIALPVNAGSPPPIVFADGGPAPVVTADDGVLADLAAIATRASSAIASCSGGTAPTMFAPQDPPVGISVEPGHFSSPAGCSACLGNCNAQLAACVAIADAAAAGGAVALSELLFVGFIIDVSALAAATAACVTIQQGCESNCHNIGSPCRPQACGDGACDFSETCLDTGAELCCSAGFSPCNGPKESCVDETQATCLASGAGCPFKADGSVQSTCGSGPTEVCCPSGICNGDQCVPPPAFGITAAAQGVDAATLEVCVRASGFTPGAEAQIIYTNVPGMVQPISVTSVLVASDGTFSFFDNGTFNQLQSWVPDGFCTPTQLQTGNVTVEVIDGTSTTGGTGQTATATIDDDLFCANSGAFERGGGCF
jgi:hypothetical protein